MGQNIESDRFSPADYRRYAQRLQEGLQALAELLERPGFGEGRPSLGAELEMFLVDAEGRPARCNEAVIAAANDPRLTVELLKYNLEGNLVPGPLAGRPFSAMRGEMESMVACLHDAAASQAARAVMIGILPTIREVDLKSDVMTDTARFRALSANVRRMRQGPFDIHIDGEEPLQYAADDVTVEGANTGFQLHLRVEPAEFSHVFNAVQLATPPVLAVAGNSPTFLEHRLWSETRIALFKQAVDERHESWNAWRPPRVSFGNGWVRESAYELFAETVALHAPLLPVVSEEDPLACVRAGGVPKLDEVRLHHGTVWRWNRGIYDPTGEGHLRIELRALPAGPSVVDMLANAAFVVGLTLGLREDAEWMATALPWEYAEYNFYRAAQYGLDATLLWPSREPPSPRPVDVPTLIEQLLPIARQGLLGEGVDAEEVDSLLDVIARRVETRQTGSVWQRRTLTVLDARMSRSEAIHAMLEAYIAAGQSGAPVHDWPVES